MIGNIITATTNIPINEVNELLEFQSTILCIGAILDGMINGNKLKPSVKTTPKHAMTLPENASNGFDFLAECIFQNQKEEQDFLDELESKHTILEKNIYNIISDLKKEEFSEIYSKIDKRYKEDSKE